MITFYQHVYPIFDYVQRAERQRDRIRKAFSTSHYPYRVISVIARSEHETLERMQWDAWKDGSMFYAYVHLKGITHPGNQKLEDWCELLEYFSIDCWRLMREGLERGADLMGVNLEPLPVPHYAGNFFWMKRSAAVALRSVREVENPEMWVGSGKGKVVLRSLHDSDINHYEERYPKERYL